MCLRLSGINPGTDIQTRDYCALKEQIKMLESVIPEGCST